MPVTSAEPTTARAQSTGGTQVRKEHIEIEGVEHDRRER